MASHCPWVGKGKREAVPAPEGRGREEANGHTGHTAPSALRLPATPGDLGLKRRVCSRKAESWEQD